MVEKEVLPSEDFTLILNSWIRDGDLTSANQLKSIIYYHLKGIVKKQIKSKADKLNSTQLLEQLPNTTSLLHDVLVKIEPPGQCVDR